LRCRVFGIGGLRPGSRTAQIANAAGVAAIGAAFSAIEANRSAKPALFVALALFAHTIGQHRRISVIDA
jgi:hypothetical protein